MHSFCASAATVYLFFFVIGRVLTKLDNRPVENALLNLSAIAEAPGSWAYVHTCDVASPTKKPIVKVAVDVKEAQATKKTRGSYMLAEGMM